jgi:metal-sulfur cluster biosynthetic enzyme
MSALSAEIRARLGSVYDPCSVNAGAPLSVVDMGLITALEAGADGTVTITLRPTSPMCTLTGSMVEAIESAVAGLDGVNTVAIDVDPSLGWSEESMTSAGRATLRERRLESQSQVPVRRQEWKERVANAQGGIGGPQT